MAGAPKVEITSEMIEAGLDAFQERYPGGMEVDDWSQFARTVLVPVYEAMELSRRGSLRTVASSAMRECAIVTLR